MKNKEKNENMNVQLSTLEKVGLILTMIGAGLAGSGLTISGIVTISSPGPGSISIWLLAWSALFWCAFAFSLIAYKKKTHLLVAGIFGIFVALIPGILTLVGTNSRKNKANNLDNDAEMNELKKQKLQLELEKEKLALEKEKKSTKK